jgi:hypothetical protein
MRCSVAKAVFLFLERFGTTEQAAEKLELDGSSD